MKTQAFKFAPRTSGDRVRRIFAGVLAALLVGALLFPTSAGAANKPTKVDVCHATGGGTFGKLNIAENAVPAHLKHGDGLPGDPVPGKPGYVFSSACVPVNVTPPADVTPPVVTVPADQTVVATSAAGAAVTFSASADDAIDGSLTPNCDPVSGSTFQIGETSVTCSATDAAGNTGSATFAITVAALDDDADGDGVSDDIDNCPAAANSDQLDRYGSAKGDACEDSNGDSIPDVDESNICVSIDGAVIIQSGLANCFSAPSAGGGPNVAIAHGSGSYAGAFDGANNAATAIGENSEAQAYRGVNNSATASGDYSIASAWGGDNNTATASGEYSSAGTWEGNNNTAIAGEYSTATATFGDDNAATASGRYAFATASFGVKNAATATGENAIAAAINGDNNTATTTGENAYAAANGEDNTATATGDETFAYANAPTGCTATATVVNTPETCP